MIEMGILAVLLIRYLSLCLKGITVSCSAEKCSPLRIKKKKKHTHTKKSIKILCVPDFDWILKVRCSSTPSPPASLVQVPARQTATSGTFTQGAPIFSKALFWMKYFIHGNCSCSVGQLRSTVASPRNSLIQFGMATSHVGALSLMGELTWCH